MFKFVKAKRSVLTSRILLLPLPLSQYQSCDTNPFCAKHPGRCFYCSSKRIKTRGNRYSKVKDYPKRVKSALKEMDRQVGGLIKAKLKSFFSKNIFCKNKRK